MRDLSRPGNKCCETLRRLEQLLQFTPPEYPTIDSVLHASFVVRETGSRHLARRRQPCANNPKTNTNLPFGEHVKLPAQTGRRNLLSLLRAHAANRVRNSSNFTRTPPAARRDQRLSFLSQYRAQ